MCSIRNHSARWYTWLRGDEISDRDGRAPVECIYQATWAMNRAEEKRAFERFIEPDLNDGVVLNIAPVWELVPWTEGGRTTLENADLMCRRHNSSKGNRQKRRAAW